jgi:hypothetical protein
MTTTLERLRARAEAAQAEYEGQHARLFRDKERRQKLYSDDEHRERERALRQERSRKLDEVIEEIRQLVAEAEQEIRQLEDGDPTAFLSAEELGAAAVRKEFIADDARSLPEGRLMTRLRSVLASGDRVAIFCYWRAAEGRAAELDSRDLRGVLGEMRDMLAGPERLARAERARETIAEASAVEMFAGFLKSGARSPSEAWVARRSGAA